MGFYATQRSSPPNIVINSVTIDNFKGIDTYNSPSNVDKGRSPDAPNMIRDEVGKVRKRMGFHSVAKYDEAINGCHTLVVDGVYKKLIHSGTKLYEYEESYTEHTPIYSGMNNIRSRSFQMDSKLYILDGKKMLVYYKDGEQFKINPIEDEAYVPTIIISRAPTGGGTTFEPLNLLQSKWKESFLGTKDATVYQLTADNIDDKSVSVRKLKADGDWEELTETTHFTVDKATGKVTFKTAPGESPISGHDNIEITASKEREGYKDRINKCDIGVLYGVNGNADRLFVSGNVDYPNRDWYSQMNDPTFFGDTWYSVLGQDDSSIMGYAVLNNNLITYKGNGGTVVFRNGVLNGDTSSFIITNTIHGSGAVSKYAFAYLKSEPLFVTSEGIMAVTSQDITGERYSQNRSFYINKSLCNEKNLSEAVAIEYKDFYFLNVDDKVYVLDGLQKGFARGEPYSTFQYECYYLTGINSRVFWLDDSKLCFGTDDGYIKTFYNEPYLQQSYNDDGKAIDAHWDIPDIEGSHFYKNKTFKRLSVRIASAIATGITIYGQQSGIWKNLFDGAVNARYLDFSYIDFGKINFSSDSTPRSVTTKIRVKNADKARFRLENKENNEPFGIYAVAFEFTEGGIYKG